MSRQSIYIIIAGFFTVSIAYAIRYGYGMLLPEMLPSLGISKTQAGVIYASYFFSYTICSPVLGMLSDRYNVRIILFFFTAILGTGSFLMAFATSVISAAIFFSIAGIGHAACWAPVMALVQKQVPDNRRGTALAFTTMGSALGIAGWSFCLPPIVANFNWQTGWMSMGIFAFCVAALNFILVRDNPESASATLLPKNEKTEHKSVLATYGILLKNLNLWLIGLSYLLVGFIVLVPYTFLSTYAKEKLSMSYAHSIRLIAIIAISGMAGKLLLGILSDTQGRIRMMIACSVFLGAGCGGIAYFKTSAAIYFFTILFGLGFGAVWPVYAAAAPDYFDKKSAGSVIGLWTVFLGIGSIISPVICGWTIDITGDYTWAFLSGLICAVISCILLLSGMKLES